MNNGGPGGSQNPWNSGEVYERYMGRWSSLVAREFLSWLDVAPGCCWLDLGSGTGALTRSILELNAPTLVKGIDRSEDYVLYARKSILDRRALFDVADAQALAGEPDGHYDAVVSGLVLNFLPQPQRAVREMARVAKPGGAVAAYVWDYARKMQFLRHFWNAATALDPSAFHLDEGRCFPLCQPEALTELFRSAGLQSIEVRAIEVSTDFRDFDDYWLPFLGGQGPAPSYTMSLTEESRRQLRERIRASLPFAIDGSIPLVARAWAVRGLRPRTTS